MAFEAFSKRFKQDIFPSNWINPEPKGPYDLIVIGGGPGGMTAAFFAKTLGAHVALVEKEHFGGECLSYGCIPSKAFLKSSRVANTVKKAKEFGITIDGYAVDFKSVMQRVYNLQTTLSPYDSPLPLKNLGIDIFLGEGKFLSASKLQVGSQTLDFKKALIMTGTEPKKPQSQGLSEYLTNQTIFTLGSLPSHLAVIGGGPISCELAQGFLRLGSRVTLITHSARLLPKEEEMASKRLLTLFEQEGMRVFTKTNVTKVENRGKEKILHLDNSQESVLADEILVAIGRKPAIEGLNLEKASVRYNPKEIETNEFWQTSNPSIYASGDVASPFKFTHMSTEFAKQAVVNALQGNREKKSTLLVPWCTYTDPELAHVGLNEEEAQQKGHHVESIVVELKDVDRALLDGESEGFLKLVVEENRILGATLMAAHAGEILPMIGQDLLALAKTIHPFPTQAQIFRTAAEALHKKREKVLV